MERSIKDSCGGIGRVPITSQERDPLTSPSGEGGTEGRPLPIPYSPRFAIAIGTEGVVIEGEGVSVCTAVYVGFWSGDHKGKGMCRW